MVLDHSDAKVTNSDEYLQPSLQKATWQLYSALCLSDDAVQCLASLASLDADINCFDFRAYLTKYSRNQPFLINYFFVRLLGVSPSR